MNKRFSPATAPGTPKPSPAPSAMGFGSAILILWPSQPEPLMTNGSQPLRKYAGDMRCEACHPPSSCQQCGMGSPTTPNHRVGAARGGTIYGTSLTPNLRCVLGISAGCLRVHNARFRSIPLCNRRNTRHFESGLAEKNTKGAAHVGPVTTPFGTLSQGNVKQRQNCLVCTKGSISVTPLTHFALGPSVVFRGASKGSLSTEILTKAILCRA